MSDERRRELARRSGGDEEAAARQLLERVRAGEVSEDRVFLAAWAGDAPSRLVMADNEILRDVVRASGNHQFRLDSTRGLILNEADKLLGWRVMLQYAHDCVQHAVVSRIPESWTGLLSAYRFVGAWLRNDARLMKEIAATAEYWTLSADEDADPFQMLEGLRLQALEESHHVLVNDDPQSGPAGDLYQVRSIARLTDSLLYRLSGRDRGGFYPVPTREIVDECLHSLQDVHEAFVAECEWERLRLIGLLLKTGGMKNNRKRRNADANLRDLERRAYDSNEDFLRYSAARLRAGLGPVEVVLQPKDIYTEGGPTSMIRGVGYLVRPALRAGHIDGSRQTAMLYAAVQRPEGWSVVQLRRDEDEKWSASGSVTIADPSEETAMAAALEAATRLLLAWSGQQTSKNGKRRNADERRRRLERSASTIEDQARVLSEKIRAGEIPWKRAKAAGALGHPVVLALQPVTQLADAMEKDDRGIYTVDAWQRFVGFASSFPVELALTVLDLEEAVYPFVRWQTHPEDGDGGVVPLECQNDGHASADCPLRRPQPEEIEAFRQRQEHFRKLLLGAGGDPNYTVGRARLHDDVMNGSYLVSGTRKDRDPLKEPYVTYLVDALIVLTYHWDNEAFPRSERPAWVFERLRNYILNGPGGVKRNRSMKPTKQNPHFAIKSIEKTLIQQFSMRALAALVTAFDEEERDPPLWVQVAAVLGTDDPQGRGVRSVAEAKRIAGYMQGDGWDGIDGVIPGESFDLNVKPVMREIAKVARARGIRGANDASGQLAAVWVDMGRSLDKLAVAYNPLTGDLVIEAPAELVPADGTIVALGVPLGQRRNSPKAETPKQDLQAFMKVMSGLYDSMAESPGAQVRLADAFKHLKRPGKYSKANFEADLSATQTARPVPTDAKGRRLWLNPASVMNGNRDFNITGHMGGRLVVTFTMSKPKSDNPTSVRRRRNAGKKQIEVKIFGSTVRFGGLPATTAMRSGEYHDAVRDLLLAHGVEDEAYSRFEDDGNSTWVFPVPADVSGELATDVKKLFEMDHSIKVSVSDFDDDAYKMFLYESSRGNPPSSPNVVKAFFRGQDAKSGAVVSKKVTIELGDIDCDDCNGAGVNEHGRKCPTCDGQKGFKDVTAEVGVLEVRKAPIAWRNDDTRFTLLPKKLVPLTAKKTYEELLEVLAPYKVGLTYARSADGERFDNEEDV